MDQRASCIMAHLSHLSLVFGLTKPTVLKKMHFSAFRHIVTAVWFPSRYLRIALPANMQEVVTMTHVCIARKTSATSGAQVNTNRQYLPLAQLPGPIPLK